MRQLAIVGEDGQVRVEDLDLSREVRIPSAAGLTAGTTTACNWPTWSPDGERLAFFRFVVSGNEVQESAVCVTQADGTNPVVAIASPNGVPIYMAWSPDGRRLAVLMQESSSLYLRLVDPLGERPPITVAQGAPLYFAWASGNSLIATVGAGQGLAATARLTWLRLEAGQAVRSSLARLPPAGFRAPVWLQGRGVAAVAFTEAEGATIVLVRDSDDAPVTIATTGREPAIVASPDERFLAIASRGEDDGLYARVQLFDAQDGSTRELISSPFLACFWAGPDRLVTFSGDLAQRTVAVKCVTVPTGESTDFGWVRPSRDLLLLLGHFDQYAQSVALVSSDGQELVLAASRAKELENGSVPTIRQILVRPLRADGAERSIGRGRLAFWRPTANV